MLLRRRVEPEHCPRHDAQRTLRAAKQLAQLVTRIVLEHRAQAAPNAAIGQDDLQAENEILHHAITKGMASAGIRADQTADPGATLGTEMQRKDQAVRQELVV